METRGLVVIATLTAVNFVLADIWMSLTKYNYARLHLLLVVPILLLEFVPPRPLGGKFTNPTVRWGSYIGLGILSIVAVVFSVFSWDQHLWANGVVYVTHPSEVFGTFYSVPYEECLWCAFHTIIGGLWTMRVWESVPGTTKRPLPKRFPSVIVARCIAVVLCLGVAFAGYYMVESGEKRFLYLGVQLMWSFPVFAIQFGLCGHIYLLYARKYVLAVLVPSVYVVVIDTWALYRDIWDTACEYTTELKLFGLMFEQVLVYFLTTVLVVNGMVAAIATVEFYIAYRRHHPKDSPLAIMNRILFW